MERWQIFCVFFAHSNHTMRHFLPIFCFAFACTLLPAQQARTLDSLKTSVQTGGTPDVRMAALEQVLKHYAAIPLIDSIMTYADYGLNVFALDSVSIYRIKIYKSYYLGLAMSNIANYAQTEQYYQAVEAAFLRLHLHADAAYLARTGLSTLENKLKVNIGTLYMDKHRYDKADSCYTSLITALRARKDTSMLIYAFTNQAVLYMYIAIEKGKDSVDIAELYDRKANNIQNEAIDMARLYVHFHPDDVLVRRRLMHLLCNKSATIIEQKKATPEEKKQLLMILVESVLLAREHGYPGKDLLIPQNQVIMLYRVLGRYDKALETAAEVIQEARSLGLVDIEANAYQSRSQVYWEMQHYTSAIADADQARELFLKAQSLSSLIALCENTASRIRAIPVSNRHQYREAADRFDAFALQYREQAKAAQEAVRP